MNELLQNPAVQTALVALIVIGLNALAAFIKSKFPTQAKLVEANWCYLQPIVSAAMVEAQAEFASGRSTVYTLGLISTRALTAFRDEYARLEGKEPNIAELAAARNEISSAVDRVTYGTAKQTGTTQLMGCVLPLGLLTALMLGAGCAVIHGSAGDSGYTGFAFGEKASSTLAGLNITEVETPGENGVVLVERGVGIDKAGSAGEADMGKILGNLLLLGLQSQGLPVRSQATPAVSEEVEAVSVTPAPNVAPVRSTVPSGVVSAFVAEAQAVGKPLVVVAGSPACGYCVRLDAALDASALATRTDIVLYRETAEWAGNGALAWTGGGNAPIVRVTSWDGSGKIVCDKKLNRPTVAQIEAALAECKAPE